MALDTNSGWTPSDQAAREQALDCTQSFIVQAPAGSGKTGLLVQRYLALLALVDEPEEILAITFTRKATGEMRERVLRALAMTTQPAADDAHAQRTWQLAQAARARDAARGWCLNEHPSRLRILTIDALNASLTRQLPLLSGFGTPPRITDRAAELYRQAARRTLRGDGLEQAAYAPVRALLGHLDGDYQQAEEQLMAMLARRQQWLLFLHLDSEDRDLLEAALRREIEAQLEDLAGLLLPWREDLLAAIRFASDHIPDDQDDDVRAWRSQDAWPLARAEDLPPWRGLTALLLTKSGDWRKRWDKNIGLPAGEASKAMKEQLSAMVADMAEQPELLLRLGRIGQLPPWHYDDGQWHILADMLRVLRLAVAHLQLVFQEQVQVDHPEVALRALRALGEEDAPTDLALKLDYRIRHLLVDEFQDTSRPQVDLLQRLTAGWQPDDGRSVFLVGDPMQSIYRFRQAEVGLFLQARRHGLGPLRPRALNLRTNFRSHATVVEWVNETFSRLFPSADDLSGSRVAYAWSETAPTTDESRAAVCIHPLFGTREETAQEEARRVAEQAAAFLDEYPTGDVAILVRRRQDLAAIIPALRRAELAFEAVEIESLARQPVVQDLYALTRILLHPADDLALLAALRAPWCGLDLAALDRLVAQAQGPLSRLYTISDLGLTADAAARWRRVAAILHGARHAYRRETLRGLVENTWRRLGGPACLRDARERADATAFFELLEQLDEAGDCDDPVAIAERLAGLYARPDVSPAAARLKLMTIHKAKGLEFDCVMLPGLASHGGKPEQGLLLWQERARADGAVDLLLGSVQAKGEKSDEIQSYVRAVENELQRQEQLRLLYVATTRARRFLHLFGAVDGIDEATGKRGYRAPTKGSLLAELWPRLEQTFEQGLQDRATARDAGASLQREAQVELFTPEQLEHRSPRLYRRLPADWNTPEVGEDVDWARQPAAREWNESLPFAWASMRARHIGTVVHAWLERIAKQGLDAWPAARADEEQALIRYRLHALGVPDEHLDEACDRVKQALRQALADERGRWILQAHPEAQCEYALNAWLDDRLQTLIIDRTFVDESGTRWIIDYKTSTHQGSDLDGFLEHEGERYQAQLQTYARAMRELENRPIRLALYFPLLARFMEIGPSHD